MRFITHGLVVVVAVIIASVNSGSLTSATGLGSWAEGRLQKVAEVSVSGISYLDTKCAGTRTAIYIEGTEQLVDGCVFGKNGGTRVAMYIKSGAFSYAVAGVTDSTFIPIVNFCEHYKGCIYSQPTDTALVQTMTTPFTSGHAVIKDFSKRMVLHTDTHRYYQFEYPEKLSYLNNGGDALRTQAIGISDNGDWGVVEVRGYGMVRIDMRTLALRRITAPGATYGHGFDPEFNLAINNDGTRIAIAGRNSGLSVVEVSDACGDAVIYGMPSHFDPSSTPCPYVPFELYKELPGFRTAYAPRFSANGRSLGVSLATIANNSLVKLSPHGGKPASGNESKPGRHIAFGDSFSSGEGELDDTFYIPSTNTQANRCHVSTRSYPYILQNRWLTVADNRACSGAKIGDVHRVLRVGSSEDAVQPTVISLGVGGNDAGLMGKLSTCLQPGTCEWAEPARRIATAHEIKALFQPLTALIGSVRSQYIGAPLFIVGYPKIINDTDAASCGVLLSGLLNTDERIFMNQSIAYLNQVLRVAADYSRVQFVDIEQVFEGQRLCDKTSLAMNGIRYGDDIAPLPFIKTKFIGSESFHPTPYGHTLVATTIYDQLGDAFLQSAGCSSCQFDESMLVAPAYWSPDSESEWSAVRQFTEVFITAKHPIQGSKVGFTFQAGSFASNEKVTLEIHSEVVSLGEFTANIDGSLSGTLSLPENITGYHTVHARGESPTGDSLDVYQTVFIGTHTTSNPNGSSAGGSIKHDSASPSDGTLAVVKKNEAVAAIEDTPTVSGGASVLGKVATDAHNLKKETSSSKRGDGSGGILGAYLILVAVSLMGAGCIYWYARAKTREVDK